MNNDKRIAIIGGGPGGLTLARILHTRGLAVTVFELDEHALSRPQGGSLDLHTESGLLALREAGLTREFEKVARYDDQCDALYDHQGKLHFRSDGSGDGGRPEIDRTQLRDLLLQSLPPQLIRWASKISGIEPIEGGKYRVLGKQGSLGDFDLVVGADGAWSKVRPLVSQEMPAYTGVLFIELSIDEADEKHPEVARLVPHGKISAIGKSIGLIAQRSSGGHVRAYFMFRVPADWAETGGLDLSTTERARETLKGRLPGWSPLFFSLIDACNQHVIPRPIVALPVGHRWTHRPGVTLIGDAAHVMTPFSGEGVNMAMLDATELALALAANEDWSQAVAGFEERMFVRAAEASAGAMEGLSFVSDDALRHSLDHFRSIGGAV